MRVVEEVALDAPGLVIDLLPHRARLHIDLPSVEFQRTEARFRRTAAAAARCIIGRSGRPGISFAIENFFSVEGHA